MELAARKMKLYIVYRQWYSSVIELFIKVFKLHIWATYLHFIVNKQKKKKVSLCFKRTICNRYSRRIQFYHSNKVYQVNLQTDHKKRSCIHWICKYLILRFLKAIITNFKVELNNHFLKSYKSHNNCTTFLFMKARIITNTLFHCKSRYHCIHRT